MKNNIQKRRRYGRYIYLLVFTFIQTMGLSVLAVEPVISVRFANPQYDCMTKTYCIQVEFQSDTPDKQLFGMNVRFWYDDKTLEFVSFSNYANGYGPVNPNPPNKSIGNTSSGKTLFGLNGAAVSINGGVELVNPTVVTYLSTSGWTRLFNICFKVDDQEALLSGNFCPSVIWDLEENPLNGGFYAGDGVVITLVKTQFQQTEPCQEKVLQFNWAYDGVAGMPFGNPESKVCIAVPCGINAADDQSGSTPVNGTTGGTAISNVLVNDKLNGNPATTGTVILSAVNDPNDGVTLNTTTGSVSVNPGTPAGTYLITYRICDKASPVDCDEALITVVVAASEKNSDLAIVKTVSNSTPVAGSNITFTLTVTNMGTSNNTGVMVTDVLPDGYTLVSNTVTSGTWSAPVWTIGNLDAGVTQTMTMIVRVNTSGSYANTASVSGNETDPVLANNSDTETINPVVISQADLMITKVVDNAKPYFGNNITFTVTVANIGPSNATGVTVSDVLPSGFTLISAIASSGVWTAPDWSVGTLNKGVTQQLTIVAKVNNAGSFINIASITGNENDPEPKNNSDMVVVEPTVMPQSDLTLTKTVNNAAPVAGNNVTFTITATNNGPTRASSVKVTDVLPAGYTLVSAAPSAGSWSAPVWTIGSMDNATSQTLTLIARVNAPGPYTNTATISGSEPDPVPGNNTSSVTTIPTGTTLTAVNDHIELCNSLTYSGNILSNETAGSGTLTVKTTPVASPQHGTLTITADGNFSFTPFTGYSGLDKAVIEICNAVVCAKDTLFINVIAMPEARAGTDQSVCEGGSIQLEGNSVIGSEKKWSLLSGPNIPSISGTNSALATVSGLVAGVYQFGYRLTNGICSDEDTVQITVQLSPTAYAGAGAVICSGNSYQIMDDRAGNYGSIQWSFTGPGTLTGISALHPIFTAGINDTGKVLIVMKVAPLTTSSCPSATDTVVIHITPFPKLKCPATGSYNTDVTPGSCHWVSPAGSLSTGLTGGSCSATLTWKVTNPDNSISGGPGDVSGYIFHLGVSTVTYYLVSSNGQKDSCTFSVGVLDRETPSLTCAPPVSAQLNQGECDKEIFLTSPVFRDNCTTLSGLSYAITDPDNVTAGPFPGDQLSFSFRPGTSQVKWIATDSNGEQVTCQQQVTLVSEEIALFAGPDGVICEGTSHTLQQASAPAGVTLKWSSDGNGTFSSPASLQPVYIPGTADIQKGKVTLTLTASTTCARDTDAVVLTINPLPFVFAGSDFSACEDELLLINGASARDAAVTWSASGTGNLSGQSTTSPTYTPAPGEKGLIRFVIEGRGTGSCSSVVRTDTIRATIHPALQADAGDDKIILVNTRAELSVDVTGGSGDYRYLWEPFNTVVTGNADSTETLPLSADTRFVIRVTDNQTGCSGADTLLVAIAGSADELLVFYNAISPNGDGLNDFWYIDGIGMFPDNEVMIFNRWGDKIREFSHYGQDEVLWDCTNKNGKLVPDGTYYYLVNIRGMKSRTGWIQVKSSR